jgi:uncharacterized damage-inducible protein DinB
MIDEAKSIWAGLEFRKAMLLRNVEPLSEGQMRWIPAPGRVSIAWQFWHIAEVEENWVGGLVLGEALRFPFGVQVREAGDDEYPDKAALIDYLHEVRALSRRRLEATTGADLERMVADVDYGAITVREVWAGVVTSFAWHAGQVALTAKLLPHSPVTEMKFGYWKQS